MAPLDAVTWGEQEPSEDEEPVTWLRWQTAPDTPISVDGDPDWGDAIVVAETPIYSPVTDVGDANEKQFAIATDTYDTGSGTVTLSIRGSADPFDMHDDEEDGPEWQAYSAPVIAAWRYVQVRAEAAE